MSANNQAGFVRRLTDQFNADEHVWANLKPLRELRRRLYPRMSVRKRKVLELLDFSRAQPPKDCVGYWRVG